MKKAHYIAMAGSYGCLPETCEVFPTKGEAIRFLLETFDLPKSGRVAKDLQHHQYSDLNEHEHDLTRLEVQTCTCDDPAVHSDSGEVMDIL